jgi:hypothetical protein
MMNYEGRIKSVSGPDFSHQPRRTGVFENGLDENWVANF